MDHFREMVHPLFDRSSRALYHALLRRAPFVWGLGYAFGDWLASDSVLTCRRHAPRHPAPGRAAGAAGARRSSSRFTRRRPRRCSSLARQGVPRAAAHDGGHRFRRAQPVDRAPHRPLLRRRSPRCGTSYIARGIPPERILVTGVPVRRGVHPRRSTPAAARAAPRALARMRRWSWRWPARRAQLGRLPDVAHALGRDATAAAGAAWWPATTRGLQATPGPDHRGHDDPHARLRRRRPAPHGRRGRPGDQGRRNDARRGHGRGGSAAPLRLAPGPGAPQRAVRRASRHRPRGRGKPLGPDATPRARPQTSRSCSSTCAPGCDGSADPTRRAGSSAPSWSSACARDDRRAAGARRGRRLGRVRVGRAPARVGLRVARTVDRAAASRSPSTTAPTPAWTERIARRARPRRRHRVVLPGRRARGARAGHGQADRGRRARDRQPRLVAPEPLALRAATHRGRDRPRSSRALRRGRPPDSPLPSALGHGERGDVRRPPASRPALRALVDPARGPARDTAVPAGRTTSCAAPIPAPSWTCTTPKACATRRSGCSPPSRR